MLPGASRATSVKMYYLAAASSATCLRDSELMQYLNPLGAGPSGNT